MAAPISKIRDELKKLIESFITPQMKKQWAEYTVDIIYKRTKAGKGLTINKVSFGGNSLKKLDDLSPGYIRQRSSRILGPYASPKRSNLTLSGELLESIIAKSRGNDTVVEIEDVQHGSGIGMRKLAKEVSDAGRPFFGLSGSENKILESFIKRQIRDKIRKQK